MPMCESLTRKTHYDTLGVKEDANYEEIRSSYKSAILDSHPDKLQMVTGKSNPDMLRDRFIEVQRAWEILSNARSRVLYDSQLLAVRQDATTADDVSLEDISIEDDGEVLQLFYQCRCGDYFSIDSPELQEMGYSLRRDGNNISLRTPNALPSSVVLPCGSCSLKVRLLISEHIILPSESHS